MKTLFTCLFAFLLSTALFAQENHSPLVINNLVGDYYVYTTFKNLDGSPFPSNSMYVVTEGGIIMIDTPWDSTQMGPLLDSMQARHNKKVIMCIVTHYHDDRTAGLGYLKSKGIITWSGRKTWQYAKDRGQILADRTFSSDTVFEFPGLSFETFYPGEGHTRDNIIIYFPIQKVLYGGCLVKSIQAQSLGNVADASLPMWPLSIKNVMVKYPKALFVIPGHQAWSDKAALKHTIKLIDKHKKENKKAPVYPN
jgi:metallo-beta-lactamase class B